MKITTWSFSVQETSINFNYTIAQKFGVSKICFIC